MTAAAAGQRERREKRGPRISNSPLYRALRLLVVFKVAIVVFAFYPPALDGFALTKSVVSHVTALLLGALLIWLLVRYGADAFTLTPVHLAVIGLVAAFAIATPFAIDRTIALFGVSRRYLGLAQVLDDAVLFLAVATVFRTRSDRARLAIGLLVAAVPVTFYGLVQRSGRDFVTYIEGPLTRPIAGFGQPDTSGAYFGILAASALACALWPWWRSPGWARVGAGALSIAAAACGLFTGSRGSLLAMGGGLLGLLAVLVLGRYRVNLTLRASAFVLLIGGAVLILVSGLAVVGLAPALGASVESRVETWQTAVRSIVSRPVVGLGPDNFAAAYPALHDVRSVALSSSELQNSTHNFLLYAGTSAGILGLIGIVSLIVLPAAFAFRRASARDPDALVFVPIAAYVMQGLVTVSDISLEWIPFVAGGLVAAAWTGDPSARVPARAKSQVPAAIVGVAALAVAAYLGQAQFSRLGGSEAQGVAEGLRKAGKPLVALNYARVAIQLDGARAEYWGTFGGALSDLGNPSAAGNAYLEAAERQPWNPLYWRDLAISYVARGDEPHSIQFLERAVLADPFDVPSHDLLARLAFNRGDWEKAFDEGALAVRILSSNPDLYDAPVRAAVRLQRWTAAEDMLMTGIARHETAHLHVLLASVYSANGRRPEAIAQLDRALAIAPGDPEATELRRALGQ